MVDILYCLNVEVFGQLNQVECTSHNEIMLTVGGQYKEMREDENVRCGLHRSSLSLDPAGVQFINNHRTRTYIMQNVCLAIGLTALHRGEDAGL